MMEKDAVRHAALVSLSYCSLCQNHPISALDYANRLLSLSPSCSEGHRYLGHTYAAEALCTMNRCDEALVHMTTSMGVTELRAQQTGTKQQTANKGNKNKGGVASSPSSVEARAALCVNLASIRLQQNELDLAEKSLRKALALAPSSSDALRGMVYLHLRQGKSSSAMQLLQERRPTIR